MNTSNQPDTTSASSSISCPSQGSSERKIELDTSALTYAMARPASITQRRYASQAVHQAPFMLTNEEHRARLITSDKAVQD